MRRSTGPLLLSSVSPTWPPAEGVPVRLVGLLYMLALALAVGLSSLAIGAILSTALLDRPGRHRAAADQADRVGTRCRRVLGVVATWLGVLLAYDSYDWGSGHAGLPVSFFIVSLIFVGYLVSRSCVPAGEERRGAVALPSGPTAVARSLPEEVPCSRDS